MSLNVGILLFHEIEVLDFAGLFEVFSVASRVLSKHTGTKVFNVYTLGADTLPIEVRNGLAIIPAYNFINHPPIDILVIPEWVIAQPISNTTTLTWIKERSVTASFTLSVCTGAFLLAKVGLLNGKRATTHWEDISELQATYPDIEVLENVAYVDEARIITSAGISAGIEMSLYLVSKLHVAYAAMATAKQMQYAWES